MADAKISALPVSTTPLAGTEVLPIVQSGVTKKVSVADLTSGRAVSASGLTIGYNTGLFTTDGTLSNFSSSNNVYLNGNAGLGLALRGDGSGAQAINMYGGASNYMSFITASTERMRVHASGGVSIGNAVDPSAGNLHLSTGNLVIGTAGKGIDFSGGVLWRTGTGSPEGVVTASVGSMYTDVAGGAGTTLYVKESGTGNTGWVAK